MSSFRQTKLGVVKLMATRDIIAYIQKRPYFINYLAGINSDDMGCKIGTNRACNPFTYRRKSVNIMKSLSL